MNTLFLGIVAFLIVLAVFDLFVGVSNDAVNFLNSSIGAKVAKFKTIVLVAAVGVFAGAAMSNGMMDVARHGIMTPEYFSFYEVMCVFLAVMVTDVILLDVFNSLGLPTSTTVSMVFELLGGTFALAILKSRIEVMTPIYNERIKREMRFIVDAGLKDNCQTRLVDGQGSNEIEIECVPDGIETPVERYRSQVELYKHYLNKD